MDNSILTKYSRNSCTTKNNTLDHLEHFFEQFESNQYIQRHVEFEMFDDLQAELIRKGAVNDSLTWKE